MTRSKLNSDTLILKTDFHMAKPVRKRVLYVELDSSWAWVAAFGGFVTLLLVNGLKKSLGLLLPHLQEEFVTDTWVIGLSVSLGQALGAIICKFRNVYLLLLTIV